MAGRPILKKWKLTEKKSVFAAVIYYGYLWINIPCYRAKSGKELRL